MKTETTTNTIYRLELQYKKLEGDWLQSGRAEDISQLQRRWKHMRQDSVVDHRIVEIVTTTIVSKHVVDKEP